MESATYTWAEIWQGMDYKKWFQKINNWTDIYQESDYTRWSKFIKENIYDLPFYKKNKWRFGPQDIEKLLKNKEWIYKTYETLRIFYAEKATNIIINYVNKAFQDGSLNIVRETLDFIVSLFGENIVEEFVDKDFSIEHLKEIVMEQFDSERYEVIAYTISKEPELNLAENSRIKYKWKLSNSFESKARNLAILDFTDPMGFGPLRQLEIKEIFKGASEQTKRELETYEENTRRKWNICLANERLSTFKEWLKDRKKCIALPYIRKDITYDDLADIQNKIKSTHQEMGLLLESDPPLSKVELYKEFHKIFVKYDLKEYILAEKKKKPTLTELQSYASVLNITSDEYTTSSELAFFIILKICLFPELKEVQKQLDYRNPFIKKSIESNLEALIGTVSSGLKQYTDFFMAMHQLYGIIGRRGKISNSEHPGFKVPDITNRRTDRIHTGRIDKNKVPSDGDASLEASSEAAQNAALGYLFLKYFS